MNQYRMFFVQTSARPPNMHLKLIKHGRVCKQNNQLPTKSHDELKGKSNIPLACTWQPRNTRNPTTTHSKTIRVWYWTQREKPMSREKHATVYNRRSHAQWAHDSSARLEMVSVTLIPDRCWVLQESCMVADYMSLTVSVNRQLQEKDRKTSSCIFFTALEVFWELISEIRACLNLFPILRDTSTAGNLMYLSHSSRGSWCIRTSEKAISCIVPMRTSASKSNVTEKTLLSRAEDLKEHDDIRFDNAQDILMSSEIMRRVATSTIWVCWSFRTSCVFHIPREEKIFRLRPT